MGCPLAVAWGDLLKVPGERVMTELQRELRAADRQLLVYGSEQPDWSQLNLLHLAEPPAICWKLQNLDQLAKYNAVALEEDLR
jgi:hypothetical protein